MANKYINVALRHNEQDKQERLRAVRPEINPDEHAENINMSARTGIPVDTVSRNKEKVRAQEYDVDTDEPVTKKMMLDPTLGAAVKDNIENLSYMEKHVRNIGQSWQQGFAVVELGNIGMEQMFGEPSDDLLLRGEFLDQRSAEHVDYEFNYLEGFPAGAAEMLPVWGSMMYESKEEALGGAALGAGIGMVTPVPGGTVGGAATGFGWGMKTGMSIEAFSLEAGNAYREYMTMNTNDINNPQSMDHETARGAAVAVGMVNAGLELVSLNFILKSMPGSDKVIGAMTREGVKKLMKVPTAREAFKKFGKTVAGGWASEGATEGLQELVTVLGGIVAGDVADGEFDAPTFAEVTSRMAESAMKGSQGGFVIAGGTGGASYAVDRAKIRKANQRAQMFESMGEASKDSKVRERLPAQFQQFIRDVESHHGTVSHVYMNPELASTYFQDGFEDSMPETMRSLGDSELTGADVAIPMDEFAAFVAPSDYFNEILPDLKFSQDDLTQREAETRRAEIEQEHLDILTREGESVKADDPVYQDMLTQLQEKGARAPGVAEYEAQQVAEFINTQAEESGVDPFELYKSFNMSVRNTDLRAQTRDGVSRLSNLLDTIRNGKGPSQGDIFGDTFGEMIAKRGGIRDTGGELKARDLDKRQPRTVEGDQVFAGRKIMQDEGMIFEDVITAGIEEGYLPESAWEDLNMNDILEILDNEINGQPVYRDIADQDALTLREELDHLEEILQHQKLDLNEMANEEIIAYLNENALYQLTDTRNDMGYYSRVLRVVKTMNLPEWKDGGMAQGKVIWQKLDKAGLPSKELQWSGLEYFLASGKSLNLAAIQLFGKDVSDLDPKQLKQAKKAQTKFTRNEVEIYFESNGVQVDEIIADTPESEDYGNEIEWGDEQVYAEEEAWEGVAEDRRADYGADNNWLGIDLDDWFHHHIQGFMDFHEDTIKNDVPPEDMERLQEAVDGNDSGEVQAILEEHIFYDFDDAIGEAIWGIDHDVVEEAAMELAKAEYMDNPYRYIQSTNTDDHGDIYIFGNDDVGWTIRDGGMEHWNTVTSLTYVYSLEEAKIQASSWGIDHDVVDGSRFHDDGTAEENITHWGPESSYDATVGPVEHLGGEPENYREVKMTLPKNPGADFVEPVHFSDNNIVAWFRLDDRQIGFTKVSVGEVEVKEVAGAWSIFEKDSGRWLDSKWSTKEAADKAVIEGDYTQEIPSSIGSAFTYFIEEMQSDWHSKGRKHGYQTGNFVELFEERKLAGHEDSLLALFDLAEAHPTTDQLETDAKMVMLPVHKMNAATRETRVEFEPFRMTRDEFRTRGMELIRLAKSTEDMKTVVDATDYGDMRTWLEHRNGEGTIALFSPNNALASAAGIVMRYKFIADLIVQEGLDVDAIKATIAEKDAASKAIDAERNGAPNAPFKGDNWLALAMKRALVMAADEGYEKFAWVDAATLNDRWSDAYDYEAQYDKKMVSFIKRETRKAGVPLEAVHLTLDGEPYPVYSPITFDVVQEDMTDERMLAYQDGDKMWGDVDMSQVFVLYNQNGEIHRTDFGDWMVWIDKAGAEHMAEYLAKRDKDNFDFPPGYWEIDMTDELREKITTEGFTLFQKERIQGIADQGEAAINDVFNSKAKGFVQFNDARDWFNITLTQNADLSTFLHESGHFYLEALTRISNSEHGTDRQRNDVKILHEWMNVENGKVTREQHEKFARGYELYVMEGKAPSLKLAAAFERFRSWMMSVYRSFKNLDVELTDEVRGVMDRMLASDAMIAEAKQEVGFMPLFKDPDEAGMLPDAFAAYERLMKRTTREAEDDLEKQLMSEVTREARLRLQEEKKIATERITAEVSARPEYRADADLRKGTTKLSGNALKSMYVTIPDALGFLWSKDGGVHPDDLAGEYGYESGDALVQALITKPKKQELITKLVDEATQEVNSLKDGSANEKAIQAIHSDPTAMFLHTELKALGKRIGQESVLGVVKRAALDHVASMRVMDMRPSEYRAAEKRASAAAIKALREKNYPAAHDAKRQQLMNHYLYMETSKAKAESATIYTYLKTFETRRVQERLGKTDYLDAILSLLEGVELKQKSLKTIGRRKSLDEFITSRPNETIIIPDQLRYESKLTNYKQMTMGDFRTLRDAVKNLDHLSGLKNKLMVNNLKKDHDEVIGKLVDLIHKNNETKAVSEHQNKTKLERAKSWVANAHANLTKMEFITTWIDNDTAGFAHKLIFQPFVDAQTAKYDRLQVINKMLKDIFTGRTKGQVVRHKATYGFLGRQLKGDEILAVALNMGNEGNRQKLTTADNFNIPESQIMDALNKWMKKEDWDLVQGLLDTIDTLWPDIEAVHKRTSGIAPLRVEAVPIETPFGTYRGGYFPLVADPTKISKSAMDMAAHAEKKTAESLFENNYMKPDVERGMTQTRTGKSYPVMLSLDVIPAHINEAVHFFTHYEAVLQVDKITRDKDFRIAISETMGPEVDKIFRPWLQAIANDANVHPDIHFIDGILKHLRGGMTVVAMGYKMSTAIMQMFGLFTTLDEIGFKATANGMAQVLRHPKQTWDFINENSGEMRHIVTNFDRDVKRTVDGVFGKTGAMSNVQQYAFHMMGYIQKTVNVMTWKGAYDQAIDADFDHETATRKADSAVRKSQSAGGVKDLAAVQRGNAALQTFTMFYTYFSVLYNRLTDVGREVKGGNPAAVARLSYLLVMPVIFEAMLRGKYPEDEDEWLSWYAMQTLLYATTTVPFVRDIASGALGEYGYNMTPVAKFGQDISRAWKGLGGQLDGEDMTDAEFKALFEAMSIALKLPFGQAWSLGEYMVHLDNVEDPIRELLVGVDRDHKD